MKTTTRHILLLTLWSATAVFADRPNVLFIMSDDHAAHAIGAYGGRLAELDPTPTLDRLAADGALLTNVFCTNSICTPSRATILTGQYSHVNGVKTLNGSLTAKEQHLPSLMKAAGYQTAIIGKWHLKAEPAAFDYYAVLAGQGKYFNPVFRVRGSHAWPKNTFQPSQYDSIHSSDAITDLSLEWLQSKRDRNKPFFLMHHFKAPHDNFENAERYDWLYQDSTIPEPASLWQRQRHGPPNGQQYGTSVGPRNLRRNMGHHMFVDETLSPEDYTREAYQRYLKKFLRCVRGVDDNIARLLTYLKQTGELETTLVIYTADQGFMLGEHDYIDKRWMYEESLRMPFIAHWPASIRAGTRSDAIINNTDFAPTILAVAGVETPESMQGRSFKAILEGAEPHDWREDTYYRYWMHMAHHDNPAHFGIRTKTHKLIFFYGLPLDAAGAQPEATEPYWELYDLVADPHEMNNLADRPEHAETQDLLKTQLLKLRHLVGDTDPEFPEVQKLLGGVAH